MKRLFSGASTATFAVLITIGFMGVSGTIVPMQAKQVTDLSTLRGNLEAEDRQFWVPVARLKTDKPQRITVNNKTGVALEYLITTHTDFRVLEAGASATLSNVETPLFLNINTQDSGYRVKYNVAVEPKTNTLNVNVILTNGEDNRTLNLNETGAVYLY